MGRNFIGFYLIMFFLPGLGVAQYTFMNLGVRENHFMDRIEIMNNKTSGFNFSTTKPYNRKYTIDQVQTINPEKKWMDNNIDKYNIQKYYSNNSEFIDSADEYFKSRRPLFKSFYISQSNFFEVKTKDFFLIINPVLNIQYSHESGNSQTIYYNSRGATIRGMIAQKIGFASTITDNQERGPLFFQELVKQNKAVPGVGFYKDFKEDPTANDYFDGRGYITFNAVKYIDIQLGFDKNFIGNGYRSLFLSDNANSNLFAKINTKIWKVNYQNLFMELMPQFKKKGDVLIKRKYAVMHHLSVDINKKLNLGFFEGVMMYRSDHIDFEYLNPIIFYRHIEGNVGSPDNALAGFDVKYKMKNRMQFYGQFLLDEFILSKIKNEPSNWVNKFGYQLGMKAMDVFGIKNLDVQAEYNRVRPFTYSHSDTICNYTHYNQPLAHPLGANFQEYIGIIFYQPSKRLNVYTRVIYYNKGLDTSNLSYGGNIFKSYNARGKENDGFYVGRGNAVHCFNGLLNVSYEIKQNLYLDAGLLWRVNKLQNKETSNQTFMPSLGIRLNMNRREYDY